MITDISDLKTSSRDFIGRFISECTASEKIDAPYIEMVIRPNKVIFCRFRHRLSPVDLILNADYSRMMMDWEMIRSVNSEWFTSHQGCSVFFFYLPSEKPLCTEYKPGNVYIIDRIVNSGITFNDFDGMESLDKLDRFGVSFKYDLKMEEVPEDEIDDIVTEFRKGSFLLSGLISEDARLFATDKPEGYIFRFGKRHVYQEIIKDSIYRKQDIPESARSQFEFLLIDFTHFWETIDDIYVDEGDYVKTVCWLFNDYMAYQEKSKTLDGNITPDGLEPPCLGRRPQTDYRRIPNTRTVELCQGSELADNIFKVLLVNLRKEKRNDSCVLMVPRQVDAWNNIVKTLRNSGIS
jgi:hypothetical protein